MNRLFLLAGIVLSMAWSQDIDPVKTAREITSYRTQKVKEARDAGKPLDSEALNKELVSKAREAIKTLDVAKVDPAKALDWARLAMLAERPDLIRDLCLKYVDGSPSEKTKFMAQSMLLNAYAELGDTDAIVKTVAAMKPTPAEAASLAILVAGSIIMPMQDRTGTEKTLKFLADVEKKVPFAEPSSGPSKMVGDEARAAIADARAHLLLDLGKRTEALEVIDEALAKVDPASPGVRGLKAARVQAELLGSPLPALPVVETLGSFKDFASLKGKVVLVNFFAHWCGSCMVSYPDLAKMYKELHPQGLEMVGVTAYYGFYKGVGYDKRDMPKETELPNLKDFTKEHDLAWPIVLTERTNYPSFGVISIPTFFVLDKKGNVVRVKIDYSKAGFPEFRKTIESLMAAK
ncbi:MAG: TlpA family protein disulfide reductase [Fimbriimonadaceae bacterium]|nr:TlpA family protein disulfide reductase [Fimbriimonadaceae bacterium]